MNESGFAQEFGGGRVGLPPLFHTPPPAAVIEGHVLSSTRRLGKTAPRQQQAGAVIAPREERDTTQATSAALLAVLADTSALQKQWSTLSRSLHYNHIEAQIALNSLSLSKVRQQTPAEEWSRFVTEFADALAGTMANWARLKDAKPTARLRQDASAATSETKSAPEVSSHFGLRRLQSRIISALEAEPIEDGFTHPAESPLAEAVRDHGTDAASWLQTLLFETVIPGLGPAVLRLLGRLSPLSESWRTQVVRKALESPDIEMRDAAVQAAELWEDAGTVQVLREHDESTPWLRDYVYAVIRDLTE